MGTATNAVTGFCLDSARFRPMPTAALRFNRLNDDAALCSGEKPSESQATAATASTALPPYRFTALRFQPVHHARERDHLADVLDAADPCDRALETESEAG